MIRPLFALSIASFACSAALAQTTLHYREGQRVDPQQVARILGQAPNAPMLTRSIRLLDEPAAASPLAGPKSKPVSAPAQVPSALSLPVQFEFGSAEISPSARTQLDALAQGIKLLTADQRIVIEGHTDAVGSDEYNRVLSQRRAAAVKQFLVTVHGIDEQRLRDAGVGKQDPIEGLSPFAPQNRRVQFRGS